MSAKEELYKRLADLHYFGVQNVAQEREIYVDLGEKLKQELHEEPTVGRLDLVLWPEKQDKEQP